MAAKKKPTDYCCPVMELVVKRDARLGIRWGLMVNIKTGSSRNELILTIPKGKDPDAPHASSTYAPLSYCPFCGKALFEKARAKKSKKAVPA